MPQGTAANDRTAPRALSRSLPDSQALTRSNPEAGHALPVGTRIGEFEITGLIGEGGFGIVYLAYDASLQRQVALKEYMPASLASRSPSTATVAPRSDKHAETFAAGLRSFVNEARLLARFDHPALVKVYRFWESNGTAYMVMPYYQGPTLKAALSVMGSPPDEATLRRWLHPLLDALAVIHEANCFHRDVAPDNILLTETGPLLLDFGAARRVVTDMTQALTAVLKPGFAPIEQYAGVPSMAQGAWTDLYALACVVYYAILGRCPMSSVERLISDQLRPLKEAAAGRYSATFLDAIDRSLAVHPEQRPQSVAEFRTLLGEPPPRSAAAHTARQAPAPRWHPASPTAAPAIPPAPSVPGRRRGWPWLVALGVLVGAAAWAWLAAPRDPAAAAPPSASDSRPAQAPGPAVAPPPVQPPAPLAAPAPAPAPVAPAAHIPAAPPAQAQAQARGVDRPLPSPRPIRQDEPPTSTRPGHEAAVSAGSWPAQVDESSKCTDILLKASLEPLTPQETQFLKKVCR